MEGAKGTVTGGGVGFPATDWSPGDVPLAENLLWWNPEIPEIDHNKCDWQMFRARSRWKGVL